MTRLLVVCYGNIYRSPFVAECLNQFLRGGVEVRSAGFHTTEGRACPDKHVAMSRACGADLSRHRSVCINQDLLAWAEMIVLMDRHNWQALVQMGAKAERFVWLGILDGGSPEIPDPYDADPVTAQGIVRRLHACSIKLAKSPGMSTPNQLQQKLR